MKVREIYDAFAAHYGDLQWWPARTPYEVMVGAVLTQNTNWSNVEHAIRNLSDDLSPEFIQDVDMDALKTMIKPAGFFNQKAVYLKAITAWYAQYDYSVQKVQQHPLAKIRKEILSVKGAGKETADSVLLYAFGFPTFVVDAYTQRLCARVPLDAGKNYDAVKTYFETHLDVSAKVYNHYHAYIVMNAKEYCKKTNPNCAQCPIAVLCKKMV